MNTATQQSQKNFYNIREALSDERIKELRGLINREKKTKAVPVKYQDVRKMI